MGTTNIQRDLWGSRARDWADVQEGTFAPLFEAVLRKTQIGANKIVLDIGCGSGLFCQMAAKRGAQVGGVDTAGQLLEIARERAPQGVFLGGEMEELPFHDQTFDVVTGFNVYQFAANPAKALREASRVSRRGAPVVIGVFGNPVDCEAVVYIRALGSFLPSPPPDSLPLPFALSYDGALEAVAHEAGLVFGMVEELEVPWEYPDEGTMLRGLLASGPAIRAMQLAGEETVKAAVIKTLAPFKTASGGYFLRNKARYLIAWSEE